LRQFRSSLFSLALLAAATPGTAAASRCAASDDQLLAALRMVHEKQRNVGVQAAIHMAGRPVFAGALGFANRERALPVGPDTRFPVASVTKAFTGVAALKASAAGRLDLDAPIQAYVPEFPAKPELAITPRRLAAHRAGLRHWGPERDGLFGRRFAGLAEILPLFKDHPLLKGAGADYQYSSYGYNLLGLAVERATGRPFTTYVDQTILRPLRLTRTRFDDARRPPPGLARLYSAYDLATYDEIAPGAPLILVPPRDYSHNLAGGNMSSTAEELARFGDALLSPGFLARHEFEQLYTQPTFGGESSAMSFGFFASPPGAERRLSISGANPGIQAGLMIFPERRLTVAVLSNTWGFGSRSGEMTSDLPKRLAELCAPRPAAARLRSTGEAMRPSTEPYGRFAG